MLPLEELESGAFDRITWLAFDVDDTITDEGTLHSRSLATMEALRSLGIHLAAVTGRPLGWAEVWAAQWPIDLAIGENGAGWYRRIGRKVVGRSYLDDQSGVEEARARALAIAKRVAPEIPIPPDGPARKIDVAFDIAETRRASAAEIEALESALREGGFAVVSSSLHMHAACGDWNKAKAIEKALFVEFGLRPEEQREKVAFVGDSGNDIPAFETFPLSIGVANVADHPLARYPKYVTRGRSSAGFAELGAKLVASRGGR